MGLRYCGDEVSVENKNRLNDIVSVDPELMHGTPCFRGTRVPVKLLLDDLKSGFTLDDFLAGCPLFLGNPWRATLSWRRIWSPNASGL